MLDERHATTIRRDDRIRAAPDHAGPASVAGAGENDRRRATRDGALEDKHTRRRRRGPRGAKQNDRRE